MVNKLVKVGKGGGGGEGKREKRGKWSDEAGNC